MQTANDILCSMFADRAMRIKADLTLPATDAEIAAHLAGNVIEGNAPTVAEFRAAESAYPAEIAKGAAIARQAEIMDALDALDRKSIRAIREGDAARIAQWEAQAVALRAELATLGV
jgi:hypothetical protein